MAKKEEGKATQDAEVKEVAGGDQQAIPRIQIDDRGVQVDASDYWHLSGTPEEIVVRFGNTKGQPAGGPVKVNHRLAISYFTAKRLLGALAQTMKRYEAALSSMDVKKGQ